MLKFKNTFYLPSGRIFLFETVDGYPIECTEMRDVLVDSKQHNEVRTSTDPKVIWQHLRPYSEKWLLTVSTQKGCPHNCTFCDVAPLPFKGNLSKNEILAQIYSLIRTTPYAVGSQKVKIGFARMGEPAHNLSNVLGAMRELLPPYKEQKTVSLVGGTTPFNNFEWLPCFNSILPRKTIEGLSGEEVLKKVIEFKETVADGMLHLQISCNSTNEDKRKELFGGADVLTLPEVVEIINKQTITKRTVTLNFIVMNGVEVDVQKLVKMGLNPDKFTIKLIPLNLTKNSEQNGLETFANYNNYEDLQRLAEDFKQAGLPVVFDAIAKCEEAGLCCGQLAHIYLKE